MAATALIYSECIYGLYLSSVTMVKQMVPSREDSLLLD